MLVSVAELVNHLVHHVGEFFVGDFSITVLVDNGHHMLHLVLVQLLT